NVRAHVHMRQSKATSLNNFANNVHLTQPHPILVPFLFPSQVDYLQRPSPATDDLPLFPSQVDYLQRPSPATDDLSLASVQLTALSPLKINLAQNQPRSVLAPHSCSLPRL